MKRLITLFCAAALLLCSCQKTTTYQVGSTNNNTAFSKEEKLENYLKEVEQEIQQYGEQSSEVATTYNNISVVYLDLNENEKSLEYSTKARLINETLGNDKSLEINYSNIGEAYFYMEDYKKAIEYYKKSLSIEQRLYGKGSIQAITTVQGMSDAYRRLEEYDKALELLFGIIEIDIKTNGVRSESLPYAYRRVGKVYFEQKDYSNAINYYEKALEGNKQTENHNSEFEADINSKFGDIYDKEEPLKAIEYYKKAYDFYIFEKDVISEQIILCEKLMENYSYIQELENAKKYGVEMCALAERYGIDAGISEEEIKDYKEELKEVYCQLMNDTGGADFEGWYQENVVSEKLE